MNEKLLRLVLVLVGLATLGGFGWKMFGFVQNQDTIVAKHSIAKLEATFGKIESSRVGGHLLHYDNYKVIQNLNVTGYVPPPPPPPTPVDDKPKPRIAEGDVEVPMIQYPSGAWIQGKGERATPQHIPGDFIGLNQKFELNTKKGLDLKLVAVRKDEVEIKVLDTGDVLVLTAETYKVDQSRAFVATAASNSSGANSGGGTDAGGPLDIPTPQFTEQVQPGMFAVGSDDVSRLEKMSQEEILASVPVRVARDPLSNEVRGLRIRSVPENSVFSRLGLQADDIVLEVNGEAATDRDQLFQSMRQLDTDTLMVRVERLGGVRTLTFRLPR
ncbi:MAG: PDZ domain-containing protein [Planctomycetota bacterium]